MYSKKAIIAITILLILLISIIPAGAETAEEWVKKGKALYDQKKYDEAIKCYDKSLELVPKDSNVWSLKGIALDKLGKYEEAIKCYDKSLELGTKDNHVWAIKGNALDKLGKYEEAIKCYDKSLELGYKNPRFILCLKGIALGNLCKYEEAIKCYDKALVELGSEILAAPVWAIKGSALNEIGKYEEAIKCYDKALELDPTNTEVQKLKKECSEKLNEIVNSSSINEGCRLIDEGVELYNKSDFQSALDKWEKALKIFQENRYNEGIFIALNNIGNVYHSLSKYEKALEFYTKALEIKRKIGDIKGECDTLNNIGVVYSGLGKYEKALDYYTKALEINRKIGDVNGEGDDLGKIGKTYYSLNEYKKSLDYYTKALEIKRKIGDAKGEGVTLNDIGLIYLHLDEYKKSLDYYAKALDIHRKIGNLQGEGAILGNIGIVYNSLGEYQKALDYHKKALEIDRQIDDSKGEEKDLQDIGNVYSDVGNYSKSLGYYTNALKIARKIGDIQGEGDNLIHIGNCYSYLGKYEKSLDYYTKTLELYRKIGNVKGEGNALNNIGMVYSNLGDYPKALEYLTKALEIAKQFDDIQGEGNALNNIGLAYSCSGEYEKSLDYYTKALEKRNTWLFKVIVQGNMVDVYLAQGNIIKLKEILKDYKNSSRSGEYYLIKKDYKKAKENFFDTLQSGERTRNFGTLFLSYLGLGLSEEGLKNYKEAEKYYKKAVELVEHQRDSLTPSQRKNFFDGKVGVFSRLEAYEGLVRVLHYLNRDSESFLYAESTKARVLSEEIARKYEGTDCKLPEELAEKERDLTNKIASIYQQMDIAYEKNNQERFKELEEELKPLKTEQEKFISKLRQNYPEYASIMYTRPLKIEEINLKEGEVLIEYEVTDTVTFAYLIKKGKIIKTLIIPLTGEELTTLVKSYRSTFETINSYSDLAKFNPQTGKKLYELLMKDLLSEIKNEKIIIVPDEILGILPFEALITDISDNYQIKEGKYGPCPQGLTYMGDTYNISYYQSASALSMIRTLNKGGGKKGLFAAGDPVFSDKDLRSDEKTSPQSDFILSFQNAVLNEGFIQFSRLSLTGEIIQKLSVLFQGKIDLYTGLSANEQNIKNKDLKDYTYLLFATHGILDNDVPYIKEPALVLTLVNNKEEDGFFTMGEVMNKNMEADVAVLSACKTGLGKTLKGEGVMGMGRAFQYSGVRSVLMSLWSVESVSTNIMTEKYFEYLKEGKSNMEALKKARQYIRSQGYEHPVFWAPFILVGD